MIIDNEAGLEHLSRRTTRDVQIMFIVSDLSIRGIVAAERVARFSEELDIHIEKSFLILNNAHGNHISTVLQEHIDMLGIPLLGVIAHDEQIAEFDASGKPLIQLGEDSTDLPVYVRNARESPRRHRIIISAGPTKRKTTAQKAPEEDSSDFEDYSSISGAPG